MPLSIRGRMRGSDVLVVSAGPVHTPRMSTSKSDPIPTGAMNSQGNPHRVLKAGRGVLLVGSGGAPWAGNYAFSSGDLDEDLISNYFPETPKVAA
jgi:Mn-containing catalase